MFRHIHGLLEIYLKHCGPETKSQMISVLAAHPLALHHSQSGAWVVCECLAQGTPKIRKQIIKALKDKVADLVSFLDFSFYIFIIQIAVVKPDIVLCCIANVRSTVTILWKPH